MAKKKKSKESVLNLEDSQRNIISYILGIVSIVMAFLSPIVGVIFGIIGLTQGKGDKTKIYNRAKRLNIIGIILGVALFILTVVVFSSGMGQIPTA